MKTERMFSILIHLLQKRLVSADELAEKYEVSKRTIYRDMDALSAIGIPIISHLGKNGGFSLIENYQLDKFTFNDHEKKLLLESLAFKKELFDHKQLAILQRKLELLKDNNEEINSNISIASATLHRKVIEEATKVKIKELLSVIEKDKKIHISYVSQTGDITYRVILPLKLNFNNGSWYLEAFCEEKGAYRLFKLTRIRAMEVLQHYPNTPPIPCTANWKHRKANVEEIILHFTKSELGKLYDFFTEDEITMQEHDVTVTFNHDTANNLLPFLLMFGRHVKVISPQWLKNQYRNEIKFIYES